MSGSDDDGMINESHDFLPYLKQRQALGHIDMRKLSRCIETLNMLERNCYFEIFRISTAFQPCCFLARCTVHSTLI